MRLFFAIIFTILFFKQNIAQDTIYFRNKWAVIAHVKEVNPDTIKYTLFSDSIKTYYSLKDSILKIRYSNGAIEHYEISIKQKSEFIKFKKQPINYDSLPLVKNSFRYYFTDIFFNKISLGYERMLNKKYSLDIDAFYKFRYNGYIINDDEYYGKRWLDKFYYRSEGSEIKIGLSRHYYFTKERLSFGAAISYRQQSLHNILFDASDYFPEAGVYSISQTKKGLGAFLKFNVQFDRKKSGIEFFITPGFYYAFTKNEYHSWKNPSNGLSITIPTNIPKLQTNYMKEGFAFLPYINFGFDVIIKQREGWYKNLLRERDSLKFNRKNIFVYNLTELIDNALGFSYFRIFYKPAISLCGSASIPLNKSSILGTALMERNGIVLDKKFMDFSVGANYNLFSPRQQSFGFIGPLFRVAQFSGTGDKYSTFILNKYYAFVNTGFIKRTDNGFSFLVSFAVGHYYNNYIKSTDPQLLGRPKVIQNPVFNASSFSIQFGYSF